MSGFGYFLSVVACKAVCQRKVLTSLTSCLFTEFGANQFTREMTTPEMSQWVSNKMFSCKMHAFITTFVFR